MATAPSRRAHVAHATLIIPETEVQRRRTARDFCRLLPIHASNIACPQLSYKPSSVSRGCLAGRELVWTYIWRAQAASAL